MLAKCSNRNEMPWLHVVRASATSFASAPRRFLWRNLIGKTKEAAPSSSSSSLKRRRALGESSIDAV